MNYATKVKNHCEDVMSALAQQIDKDAYACIEDMDGQIILVLNCREKSYPVFSYNYTENQVVDETSDNIENWTNDVVDAPIKHIKTFDELEGFSSIVLSRNTMQVRFARYCNILAVNHFLADIEFEVVDEVNPSNEERLLEIVSASCEKCKILVATSSPTYQARCVLSDQVLVYRIDYIS